MKHVMTVVDYTLASVALVLFVACMFVTFIIDYMRVPQ